jgi:asparagine synthase (glutamine-hydrolysing)
MCGIAGEFRFDDQAPDAETMARMLAKLARRGPDAEGQHADGPMRLGHRRLAIIDLAARSQQPMVDAATGTALVFNGTIYNYPELRAELIALGHVFHSDGDTEVILRAYLAWGEACVERLHGMFAFAIWNRGTLFLARDRLGIKPLYYTENFGCFRFAWTPPARLAAGGGATRGAAGAPHPPCTLRTGGAPTPASTRSRCTTCSPCTRWCRRRARSATASGSSRRAPR